MGRVAKYKKIKSFDPYSKQNKGRLNLEQVGVWGLGDNGRKAKKRSRTSEKLRAAKRSKRERHQPDEGFDLPPQDEDDFDPQDLTGSVRRQKKPDTEQNLLVTSAASAVSAMPTSSQSTTTTSQKKGSLVDSAKEQMREERKLHRMLKLDEQANKAVDTKTKQIVKAHERLEGESKNAYKKRVRLETQQLIQKERQERRNPERMEKKREFMKNKRSKKNSKKSSRQNNNSDDDWEDNAADNETLDRLRRQQNDNDNDDNDGFVTGEKAYAKSLEKEDYIMFGEQVERPPTFRHLPRGAKVKPTVGKTKNDKKGMDSDKVKAEARAMEQMRLQVQAQYKLIRQKRRGEFHL